MKIEVDTLKKDKVDNQTKFTKMQEEIVEYKRQIRDKDQQTSSWKIQ